MSTHMQSNFRVLQLIAITFFVLLGANCHAQYSRLKNSTSSQIGVGFTDAGLMINAYYVKAFDQRIKAQFGGGLIFGKVADISYKSLFLDGIGTYSLSNSRLVSVNALLGISFVGDYIDKFESAEYNKQFSFNYGVLGGLEAEFVATRRVSFVLTGTGRYYIKRDFGRLRSQVSAGIRISF